MRLDDLWRSMREVKDTQDKFMEALKTWKDLHFEAIELYRKQRERKEVEQESLF
jgi:hypothetical protein